FHGLHHRINSDAVGDKGRGVFTQYGCFAQLGFAELHEKIDDFGIRFWGWNDLQQA
ncbi:MAG: hypothetical protein RLZZ474_1285, partial [Bacteroidota bacterium]